MPGANARALEKARTLPADALILDLEDSVAPEAKSRARQQVVAAVRQGGYAYRELIVRINALATPWGRDDVAAVAACGADAVLVPKVQSRDDVLAMVEAGNGYRRTRSKLARSVLIAMAAALAGCATTDDSLRPPGYRPMSAAEGRALVGQLLPNGVTDRGGWATDIYAAIAALDIAPTPANICAVVAVTEQESGFQVDPAVPGLAGIARREIDKRRERAGIPRLAVDAALALPSSNGKSYSERLDTVKTERHLSELYEDFIGRVPFGKTLLADRNPVRTGGPMQVSVAFAEAFALAKPYPYPVSETIRREVFTRRGGMYFGIAHLLDYPAPYPRPLYRFADFNAGQYASRNAAFQSAVTQASGIPLELDGDVLRYDRAEAAEEPGSTELAARVLARRLDMNVAEIRRDLTLGKGQGFEQTRLYSRVFALADRLSGKSTPRAVVPRIPLQSPKITRNLTSDWFANRVEGRYQTCLGRLRT